MSLLRRAQRCQCQRSCAVLSGLTWCALYTPTCPRTRGRHMLSARKQATTQLPSRGELDEQLPVFLVFLVEALIVLARQPSETCAVEVACSLQPRSGAAGTDV